MASYAPVSYKRIIKRVSNVLFFYDTNVHVAYNLEITTICVDGTMLKRWFDDYRTYMQRCLGVLFSLIDTLDVFQASSQR